MPTDQGGKKAGTVPAYMKYKTRAVRHSNNPAEEETRRVGRRARALSLDRAPRRGGRRRARARTPAHRSLSLSRGGAGRARAPNSRS